MLLYRVNATNKFEWETTQKILFKLGYRLGGTTNVYDYGNGNVRETNIGVWTDIGLTIGQVCDEKNISFEQFINKIEHEHTI